MANIAGENLLIFVVISLFQSQLERHGFVKLQDGFEILFSSQLHLSSVVYLAGFFAITT